MKNCVTCVMLLYHVQINPFLKIVFIYLFQGEHVYYQLHVEVRGQLTEVDSVSTVWVLEIELGSPGSWQVL